MRDVRNVGDNRMLKVFLVYYLIPALFGIVGGLGLTSWVYLAFGGSVWTISFVAVIGAIVFTMLTEEMME